MNSRRGFVVIGVSAVVQAFGGCAGNERRSERYETHTETVSSVLISADGPTSSSSANGITSSMRRARWWLRSMRRITLP